MKYMNGIILELIDERLKYDKKYSDLLFELINKSYKLVDDTHGVYQVEKTISLNKISLKDYVLSSNVCLALKDNNISNYTISELKDYIRLYSNNSYEDITPYIKALGIYEEYVKLEKIEKEKIDFEINKLSIIIHDIKGLDFLNKNELKEKYDKLVMDLQNQTFDNKLLDSLLQTIGEIFNYYIYGNKELPIED